MHTEETLLETIRARSGRDLTRLCFKANQVRLLSMSRDGATLYLHACFRGAPPEVVAAVAAFLRLSPGSPSSHRAAARLREYARPHLAPNGGGSARPPAPPTPGRCCGTPAQRQFLSALYREYNHTYCDGRLPATLPLRFSDRMRRRLGHIRYDRGADGERVVIELALNIDLMLEGSERQLRDTLLHEMAHVEAWLTHGHRGHGAPWRRIARRLGCEPRACTRAVIPTRPAGTRPTTRVPLRTLVG